MPARLSRVIAVAVALAIVVGTGVAWSKIRSFESGINHISPIALGEGGEDGAIDILLVGMDSRTDAHGNPLSEEELATLRAGDDVSTNTDTIILVRIPNNGASATAISIPRDSYVEAPGVGKMKINGPQALSFVRQRHDLPRGDLDRVTRQQAVMASLAHEVISSKTLSSPSTLNSLQDAVQRSVVLSDGWDIMDFAEQLQKLAAGS